MQNRRTGGLITMLRSRGSLIISIGLLVWCISAIGTAAQVKSDWLVSPELLEHAKLKILWQNELPIRKSESLKQLFLFGSRVYALSSRNFLVSLDREKGSVIFSKSIASTGIPIVGLELYRDELISVIGNK